MSIDFTLYAFPRDPHLASERAIRDARKVRELWRAHGAARRLTDRSRIAECANFHEEQVRRVADYLLQLEPEFPRSPLRQDACHPSMNDGAQLTAAASAPNTVRKSDTNYTEAA